MAAGDEFLSHGITADTPKSLVLGAGTIHKGLTCTTGTWNFAESIIAATSGGNTLTITPEITDVEVDGANVKTKGLAVKTGEMASLETNLVEIKPDVLKAVTLAADGTAPAGATGYDAIESKGKIAEGDYIENFAFVGKRADGKPIIVVFDYALCTSGLEWGAEAKTAGVITATFECYAEIAAGKELDHLPWHIYSPSDLTPASLSDAMGTD